MARLQRVRGGGDRFRRFFGLAQLLAVRFGFRDGVFGTAGGNTLSRPSAGIGRVPFHAGEVDVPLLADPYLGSGRYPNVLP